MTLFAGATQVQKAYIGASAVNAIMHAGVNVLGVNGGGPVLPPAGRTMLANLKSSLILDEGTGGPTWSRATKAWGFNELDYLEELASGCAFFGGARLVRNTVRTKSEDFSNAAWSKSNLTVTGTNVIVCANSTSQQFIYQSSSGTSITTGQVLLCCVRLKYVSGGADFVQVAPGSSGFGTGQYATISLLDGSTNVVGCTATVTLVAADTYDFCVRLTATATGAFETWNVCFAGSLAAGRLSVFVGDGVKSFELLRAWSVDVTNYDASYIPEYVSVGSGTDKNFLLHTDDFSQADWTKTNITITQSAIANPVNGIINAQKLQATADTATNFYQDAVGAGLTAGNIFACYVKQGSGETDANRFVVRNLTTATNLLSISFNYSTGGITYLTGSSGASVTDAGNGWWLVSLVITSGLSTGDNIRIYAGFTGGVETAGEFCYVYRPYLGRGVTAPAVLPAVAGVWDPFGAGIDGAKYFETDWQGAPLPAASLLGFRREAAATNNLLHSRDPSNAAWSTKTNITAAKTVTGLDGIANTATTLTATAADAIILQPITLASAARCASAYVKRRTGSGTISFTQDGGSTWTDITSLINSSTWSRVQITSTMANPSVGFKISTSGDAIDVDCMQNEAGAVATSPIVTTTATVTRNAEALSYQTASNWSDTAGTAYAYVAPYVFTGTAAGFGANGLTVATTNSGVKGYDGTNTANGPVGSPGTLEKIAISWGGGSMTAASSGAVGVSSSYDGSFGLTNITIGTNGFVGYIGPVAIYNYQMTDAELQAITS